MGSSRDAVACRGWTAAAGVAAVLAAVGALRERWSRAPVEAATHGARTVAAAGSPPIAARASPSAIAAGRAGTSGDPLPPSLRGTDVDGDLTLDGDGRFVASAAARQLFDYFLTADGEEPPAAIRARVAAEAARRLPGREAPAAVALFDRYLDYRDRLAAWVATAPRGDPLSVLAGTEQLQRALFGAADAERLFGDDDRLARALLERGGDPAGRAPP